MPLSQALHESFPVAVGRLCMTHIEHNIKHCVENKLKLSRDFTNTVLADIRGNLNHKGLVHTTTHREYTENLVALYEKWDDMERKELGANRTPAFSTYFRKHKAEAAFTSCRTSVAADLGLVDMIPNNIPPESHARCHKEVAELQTRRNPPICG